MADGVERNDTSPEDFKELFNCRPLDPDCRISKFLFSRKVPRIHHDPGRSFETAIQLHLQDVELADSRASPNLG